MNDVLSLTIVSTVVSLVVQAIKKFAGTSRPATMAAVVALSLIGGLGYWFVKDSAIWPKFLEILVLANAIYAFVISNFEA